MLYLIVVACGAALVHVALILLARRAQPGCRAPAWLHVAWVALLLLIAAIAVRQSGRPPSGLIDALGLLWFVPAVDAIVLLIMIIVLSDRPEVGHVPDRRRLFLGVLTAGALSAAAGFAGQRQSVSGGIGTALQPKAPSQIDPIANGAVGNYTGRFGTVGDGVDSRMGIQTALNAASEVIGTDYYNYTRRRSTTVTLPPGHYLVSAPDNDASLVIPPGVVLDAEDATLYFDYPTTRRVSWCGIRVGQYGQLRLGKLYPSGRVAAPDAELVYDAVRLVQTDDNSHVIGYGDSEIRGWQGAAIRGVGAWLSFVKGLRITDNAYGYIASKTGDGTLGYAVSLPDGSSSVRNHTDLRIQDCCFVNLSHGGIIGAVEGESGRLLERDFESLSLTVGLIGCVFENIAGYAIDIASAMVVSAWDCGFEEVGARGAAMIRLENCRAASFANTRVNLAGRHIQGPEGQTQPFPAYVFQVAATESLVVDGMFAFNSFNPALRLADAEPRVSWRSGNINAIGALAPGPMYFGDGSLGVGGQWNKGHLVLGSHHLWVDGSGALRHKGGFPKGDTDGSVIG